MAKAGDSHRQGDAAQPAWAQPALLAVSFLLLTLELAQIRLFSYSLFPTVVYVAIAITLLGLGAGATVLAMSPGLRAADPRRLTAAACLGFAAAVPPSRTSPSRTWSSRARWRGSASTRPSPPSSPASPCPTSCSASRSRGS